MAQTDPFRTDYDPRDQGADPHARAAKESVEHDWLSRDDVTGVGISRPSGGEDTICVFIHPEAVGRDLGLPSSVAGTPVEIVPLQMDSLASTTQATTEPATTEPAPGEQTDPDFDRYHDLKGGMAVGMLLHGTPNVGTLGVVMVDVSSNNAPVLLSNAHVIFPAGATVGSTVYQPAWDRAVNNAVATNTRHIWGNTTVHIGGEDVTVGMDAAIATLTTDNGRTYSELAILEAGNKISGWRNPEIGDIVTKRGASTRLTSGKVRYVNISLPQGAVTLENQFAVEDDFPHERFEQGGDSGSVILAPTVDALHAVGLLWGGAADLKRKDHISCASPFPAVVAALDLWATAS